MGPETTAAIQAPIDWESLALKPITAEWPAQVQGDLCWDSSTFQSVEDFTLILTDDDVAEVGAALRAFKGSWDTVMAG